MKLKLSEIIGSGYSDFWNFKGRYLIVKGSRGSKKSTTTALKIIYNIPSGFKLTAKMVTNYRQLKTIYDQRKNHRLPEWHGVCKWIETLPYMKEFLDL